MYLDRSDSVIGVQECSNSHMCVCVCVCVYIYIYIYIYICRTSQVALVLKNLPANAGDVKRHGFNPWAGEIPWSGAWQPTPVFLPAESHGQRNLVGYSPRGRKESYIT